MQALLFRASPLFRAIPHNSSHNSAQFRTPHHTIPLNSAQFITQFHTIHYTIPHNSTQFITQFHTIPHNSTQFHTMHPNSTHSITQLRTIHHNSLQFRATEFKLETLVIFDRFECKSLHKLLVKPYSCWGGVNLTPPCSFFYIT